MPSESEYVDVDSPESPLPSPSPAPLQYGPLSPPPHYHGHPSSPIISDQTTNRHNVMQPRPLATATHTVEDATYLTH